MSIRLPERRDFSLSGERIALRPPVARDAHSLQRGANDRRVARYVRLPHPYTLEHATGFIRVCATNWRQHRSVELAISHDGEAIGIISLMQIDHLNRDAELGYWLTQPRWRQGIMREAAEVLITFAFDRLRLHRIHARTHAPNRASAALLERIGFTHEGVARKAGLVGRHWVDDHLYGLLEGEWKRIRHS